LISTHTAVPHTGHSVVQYSVVGPRFKNLMGALDALQRPTSSTARLQLAYGFDVTSHHI